MINYELVLKLGWLITETVISELVCANRESEDKSSIVGLLHTISVGFRKGGGALIKITSATVGREKKKRLQSLLRCPLLHS